MFRYDIKKRRQELGLTLEKIGKMVGVGKSTVRKWETGYIENMGRDKISRLSKALKISPSEFMGWDEDTPITVREKRLAEKYLILKNSPDAKDRAVADAIDKLLDID